MASMFSKLAQFAQSKQGREMINKAKQKANDPKTRKQAKQMFDKLRNQGGGRNRPPGR